jgi:choline trimethylamine-lyase
MNNANVVAAVRDTPRVDDLRKRVRSAMYAEPTVWECPGSIDPRYSLEPLAVRKARALALKVASMPTDLWTGQLLAGSLTLEDPRIHAEKGFPEYLNADESKHAEELGLGTGCFGHIVPDYPLLLTEGISGIKERIAVARVDNTTPENVAFFDSVEVALDGVLRYATALAAQCESDADRAIPERAPELRQMARNLRIAPVGPAESFWQALQSVWLLHMIFHATKNNNALGRIDQYAWPYLQHDLESGALTLEAAAELVDCFTLKFNERAQTNEDQEAENRIDEEIDTKVRTRHGTSSQLGRTRDRLDATNHWLQNIIVGGIRPNGTDGTNPLSFLILRSFRNNGMTNPLVTVRIHKQTPQELVTYASETLKDGGGMPAFFNDDQLIPALEDLGIDTEDARDYTNDGCWEIIIPGRTDFKFQRLSLMLCLEWALNRGITRLTGAQEGLDTGDPTAFQTFGDVWDAFTEQLKHMIDETSRQVCEKIDERSVYAPVPLLSALIEGAIPAGTDMTAGGAKYRTHGMLAESVAHTIDSLTAIQRVVFEDRAADISEVCASLADDFVGYERVQRLLHDAPKYGNDDPYADDMGKRVMGVFTRLVADAAATHCATVRFPCGVATFSWYIGIGEGLGASPDGRNAGEPVSSNFSPALGRDLEGVPAAVLSYGSMPHNKLAAGGPLDLRVAAHLVAGDDGTTRLAGLVKGFVDTGGSMLTITVADSEELKAAQMDPDRYESLRVRMGGWCAYFTALSREQQDHHIQRQEASR